MRMPQRAAGFTLLEILVVVTLIAIIVTVTALSFGARGFDAEIDREGRRLAALIGLASEEAIMQGREWGVEIHQRGYLFHIYSHDERAWLPLENDPHFRARELPEGIALELRLEGRRADLRPTPAQTPRPQLVLLSSGEHTPFSLQLLRPRQARLTLSGGATGELEFAREQGAQLQ
jgi:general secretion pathway protein H